LRSDTQAEVRLLPLLALALAMTIGFANMGSFGTVQEAAKAELGLSDYGLSIVQGVGAAVPLALLSIPVGALVDRVNRVRLLILLSLVWIAGTLITAFAPSLPVLFVGRMLTGIGTTGGLTAALSLGADWCAPSRRGRALLIVSVGKTLGIACGFALTGALLTLVARTELLAIADWRQAHVALACISVAFAIPLLLLREPERKEVEAGSGAGFRVIAAELWSRRRFLAPLFIGQVAVVMADNAAIVWSPAVLGRTYGLEPQQFAGWLGALILGTGFVGSLLGGVAADWGQKRFGRGGILAGAVAAAALGIPAALFPIAGSVPIFAATLGLLALCGTITGLITSAALTLLIPNELRGLCIGAFIAVAGVIGYGVAPALVIFVSRLIGGEAALGSALAVVGVVVSIASVFAFRLAMKRAPSGPV
jgi:MFS family permease